MERSTQIEGVLLCNKPFTTVANYRALEKQDDPRKAIIGFLRGRFKERYFSLQPVPGISYGPGFAMTALACLSIEATESFKWGWPDTRTEGRGKKAFREFFKGDLSGEAAVACATETRCRPKCFYHGVRCGILHQGETTGGWKVGPISKSLQVDFLARRVDGIKLLEGVQHSWETYLASLETSPWDRVGTASPWGKCRVKINAILDNCTQ